MQQNISLDAIEQKKLDRMQCIQFFNLIFGYDAMKYFFGYFNLLIVFLAVQNSSMGDLVTHSLT